MTHWTKQHRKFLLWGGTAIATHLLWIENAIGHAGHHDSQSIEPAEPSSEGDSAESSSEHTDGMTHSDGTVMPSADMPMSTDADASSVEEVPVTLEKPSSSLLQANVGAIGIGLGESLFALIVVGPFLLLYLKKQLQSS